MEHIVNLGLNSNTGTDGMASVIVERTSRGECGVAGKDIYTLRSVLNYSYTDGFQAGVFYHESVAV